MITLRRLLCCLFALALLPGAQARVAMPVEASIATMAEVAGTRPGSCHDAPVAMPAMQPGAHHGGADSGPGATDAMPAMDCCAGHGSGAPACGGACACPPLMLTALAPAPVAGPALLQGHAWQRHGHATRTGPPDGPPRRPPIG